MVQFLIDQLPGIIALANKLTGAHLPPTVIADGAKLYEFAQNTIENLKQKEPLTIEEDVKLDAMVEEITSRDYWKSRD